MFWLKIFVVIVFLSKVSTAQTIFNFLSVQDTFSLQKNYDIANNDEKILIDEIRIIGNNKTKPDIILRELTFSTNSRVSYADLKFNESRVFSLGIFSDVEFVLSKEENKNVLLILVQESWYIWPLPFIDIADRDWKKLTYGLHLNIQNLTGRNENLTAGFSLGYDPKFYLRYFNPIINKQHNLLLQVQTLIQRRQNRSIEAIKVFNNQNYDERYFLFDFLVGKRFNQFNTVAGSFSFEYLEAEEYLPLRTVSPTGIDRFLSLQFSYSFDTRDFTAYPKKGTNINLVYRKVGLTESDVDFNIFNLQLKQIQQVICPIIYYRNYTRVLAGPILPYYANSFIGYSERLRGHFSQTYESNSIIFNTFEFRFPLLEKYFLKLQLPVIPEELLTYTLSLDIHTFYDNVLMFNKNDNLAKKKLMNGFGFGFSFLVLPYRSINLELAWNEKFQPEIIFDLNFPF
ncbi:MAG: BamA/TamA family outer membrane protein [Ignavibacteria bacterium]|nr:BamA/TamA family outer membrane protein [Ignavibacteria bacterium]